MSSDDPRVGIVVVAYESRAVLPGLLDSLRLHCPTAPVIVVENGSYQACEDLVTPYPNVRYVRNGRNGGYGAAVNLGATVLADTADAPDFLAFLNPDVRLQGPTLQTLARQMAATPDCGAAVGPAIDATGSAVPTAWGQPGFTRAAWYSSGLSAQPLRRGLTLLSRSARTSARSIDSTAMRVRGHLLGGTMMVRASAFAQVDGFDPGFFLYWEDADLCLRLRQAGFSLYQFQAEPVQHKAGSSSSGTGEDFRRLWYRKSAQLYAAKHLSPLQSASLRAGFALGGAVRTVRGAAGRTT